MKSSSYWLVFALLGSLPLSCKRSEAEPLPAATGAEAAALPSFPTLDASDTDSTANGMLTATGSTYAIREATLGPKASGTLAKVYVQEGDTVKKGQVLFALDGSGAALGVRQAEAALSAATVGLSRAQMDYDRTKELYDRGVVAPALYDQVKIGLDQAKVGLLQAKVGLSTARKMAGDMVVVSPLSGIVTAKLKNTGETVTMMPPTSVVVVQDISKIEVKVKLPENALGKVGENDPMRVRLPSLDKSIDLTVTRVNPSVDPTMRTVEVVGTIDNAARGLKAGMLAEVSFPKTAAAQGSGSAPAVTTDVTRPDATSATEARKAP
ncbi:MAG: efflux RND transporter periplasmic adaptor subunit [Polyangiaceae bacterium]|nr:efflux RND transporter periplasmic adaptor subunit [Polyangiaceae bacterium]